MTAYYNEIDPKAAAWLRELISQGHIAPGVVDERNIEDVRPDELRGYTQCHFFAGIGAWSYALRLAEWPDSRRVWTGSCPCQGFSAAGKGAGFADERHLWPAWFHLLEYAKPGDVPVFFEQVASPAALAWLDLVQADMEGTGHTVWTKDLCAAGAGAPHIRQRLYGVAHHHHSRRIEHAQCDGSKIAVCEATALRNDVGGRSGSSYMADNAESGRKPRWRLSEQGNGRDTSRLEPGRLRNVGELGDDNNARLEGWRVSGSECSGERTAWSPSDFIWCRDNKWRPVEPGTFPLAHGAPARVGRLRGYGNAIVAPLAAEFIKTYREVTE